MKLQFAVSGAQISYSSEKISRSMLLAHKEGNIQPSYHVLLKAIVKREKIIIILINTKLMSIETILHCTSLISANDFTCHQMLHSSIC